MPDKARSARNTYRFSLAGVTTIAGFAAPPVIADDRIRQPRRDVSAEAAETADGEDAADHRERPHDRCRAA